MRNAYLIAARELRAYLRSPLGYVIAAAVLVVDGLLYYAFALGAAPRLSAEVLTDFFFLSSGTTMIASILLSLRLVAEERQTGTLVLLNTAPVTDGEIVAGKFLSAFAVIACVTLATVYMPLLVFVHGKVSLGHIVVGYVGLLLLGAASVSIGLFGSVIAKTQVVAAILGAAILVCMLVLWLVAKVSDPPFTSFLAGLALHNERFRPFQQGLLKLENCVYYVAVTYFFLLAATKTLESRRWR